MKFRVAILLIVLAIIWLCRDQIGEWSTNKYTAFQWKRSLTAQVDPCTLAPDNPEILEEFLKAGAISPDKVCAGLPLTFQAVKGHNLESLRVLYRHGADFSKKNDEGKTLAEFATAQDSTGHTWPEIQLYLQSPYNYETAHPAPTPPPARESTKSESPYERQHAYQQEIATLDPMTAVADVKNVTQSADGSPAALAKMQLLYAVGDRAKPAIPALIELLGESAPFCQENDWVCPNGKLWCEQKERTCRPGARVSNIPYLDTSLCMELRLFGDESVHQLAYALFSHHHKAAVIDCIGEFPREQAKYAVPDLKQSLNDQDPTVRSAASAALRKLGEAPTQTDTTDELRYIESNR